MNGTVGCCSVEYVCVGHVVWKRIEAGFCEWYKWLHFRTYMSRTNEREMRLDKLFIVTGLLHGRQTQNAFKRFMAVVI